MPRIRTTPRLGLLTGMEVLVELQDMGRFRSSEEIASYIGLEKPHPAKNSGADRPFLNELIDDIGYQLFDKKWQ